MLGILEKSRTGRTGSSFTKFWSRRNIPSICTLQKISFTGELDHIHLCHAVVIAFTVMSSGHASIGLLQNTLQPPFHINLKTKWNRPSLSHSGCNWQKMSAVAFAVLAWLCILQVIILTCLPLLGSQIGKISGTLNLMKEKARVGGSVET